MDSTSLSAVTYERTNGQAAIHIYHQVNNTIGELSPDISNGWCISADVVAENVKQCSPRTRKPHNEPRWEDGKSPIPPVRLSPASKLAAVYDGQNIHLYYQAEDSSLRSLVFQGQNASWVSSDLLVSEAYPGTGLAAIRSRLFFQGTDKSIKYYYENPELGWVRVFANVGKIPICELQIRAPIACVTWDNGRHEHGICLFTVDSMSRLIQMCRQFRAWNAVAPVGTEVVSLCTDGQFPGITALRNVSNNSTYVFYVTEGRFLAVFDMAANARVPLRIPVSGLSNERIGESDNWKRELEKAKRQRDSLELELRNATADRDKWNGEFEKERKEKELLSSELRSITADRDKWRTEAERRQKQLLEERENQKDAAAKQQQGRTPTEEEQWVPQLILEGHSHHILCIAFSPNGKWIASGSYDESMIIRDARTGTQVFRFTTTNPYAKSAPFSPDGRSIAYTGSASLWDPITGQERVRLQGNVVMNETIAFSPDGKLVASGYRTTIHVWDASTGILKQRLVKPGREDVAVDTVRNIAFSPDGKTLASASWWSTVTLWNTMTWTMQRVLDLKTGYIHQVAFSPDGKLLATASSESRIRLWEVASGSERPSLNTSSGCVSYCVGFSPDGTFIAAGGNHPTVMVWDAKTGALVKELDRHRSWRCVKCLMFSPDSKALAFGNHDGKIKVFAKNE
ncbi:hypothetical protein HFD88_002573 [Aspergillus terreus]|nr:hypothetical protein HFD88_002573 [Aspergillus terreus]